ncbi:hypothetical protein [Bradyrhizobium sp. LHD-71]|uniref:hypothetical protein n=1 Tax=Bradyrhizobium sp. LHD-71 TaxID=3072141 RepID=UPI00280CDCCD|nr:hypothetical protein [Bradyrhizobium sp. LHD-71]MDQ8730497.1 hypothetical protein [Bradyrhizobium sp. LHD-71]
MAIKLRTIVKHPGRIDGDKGISVEKENGIVTVALDLASIADTDTIPDQSATSLVLVTPGATDADPDLVQRITVNDLLGELAAVTVSRQIISGPGLDGGGDLSSDRTLFVGAGDGIAVFADNVALHAGHVRNVDHTAVALTAGAGLTGGGDISATRSLAVGAGTGITVNANDVALDATHVRNVDHSAIAVTAGAGLTGGGTIEFARALNVGAGTGISVNVDDVALAPIGANAIMLNNSGSSSAPAGVKISALADRTVFGTGDKLMIEESTGELRKIDYSDLPGSGAGVSSLNGQVGALAIYFPPQGRLTLTSATPVMATDVAAATTVYYTPDVGDMVPLYNGTNVVPTVFTELSQSTTDATKSPDAVANNSNYDVFVWNDDGTLRATRGPAWSSATTRGTGVGTTELVRVKGVWLNAQAITKGPSAQRGTYVGTIRSNGSASIDWIFGGLAVGGKAGFFGVWNAYNRVTVATMVSDSTDVWTYGVDGVWRAANNSSTIRVSAVRGFDVDGITADYASSAVAGSGAAARVGVGLDSTTAFSGATGTWALSTVSAPIRGCYAGLMGTGWHFVSAIETNASATASTFVGDGGAPALVQTGLAVVLRQ